MSEFVHEDEEGKIVGTGGGSGPGKLFLTDDFESI